MASQQEGPNPFRPYYVPSIGLSPTDSITASSAAHITSNASSRITIGRSTRDLLSDLDYSNYLESSPSVAEWFKDLLDRAVWKYSSVLIAQPFDVAKTILQIYVVPSDEQSQVILDEQRSQSHHFEDISDQDSQSSDDESTYFTSTAPTTPSPSTPRSRKLRARVPSRTGYIQPPAAPKHRLHIKNASSLTEVISQLWSTSGPTSVWKASNATFIYSLLLPTLNTFIRSLLSAILGLPEIGVATSASEDILTAASPSTTIILSFISSALSAVVLSPIDTARTFLIATPLTHGPRSLLRAIRLLPTPNYSIPVHLIPITILHSSLPNLLAMSTPLVLKNYLAVDPVLNPSTWSFFSFVSTGLELGVRFPLETVLRRAQIATFTSPALRQKNRTNRDPKSKAVIGTNTDEAEIETIIPTPKTYRGIIGTMWGIVYEEGLAPAELGGIPGNPTTQRRRKPGQGVKGLYRGWRIGMWGLAGIWGAGFLGASMGGEEEGYRSEIRRF
ncbi:putative mitochondrial fusion protein [Talaromyces proteolyticus]|uniref:Mitochondrial fusion protein n=1 Tax=Talaromyces proteolyticus TaxID=1131652 RepID=A0AAD4KZ63_9EURO|nr:putative mitochondrial fusion protein [Talaromyces proteolyticus]KAH8702227.1 putative mitochondrial fusion protein [Talaromyces proteolyticus]